MLGTPEDNEHLRWLWREESLGRLGQGSALNPTPDLEFPQVTSRVSWTSQS